LGFGSNMDGLTPDRILWLLLLLLLLLWHDGACAGMEGSLDSCKRAETKAQRLVGMEFEEEITWSTVACSC
jgi:hypothetical protein